MLTRVLYYEGDLFVLQVTCLSNYIKQLSFLQLIWNYIFFFKKDIDSFSGSTSGLFPKEVGTVSFISLELYTLHNYKSDKYGFNTKRLQEYTEKR